MALTGSGNGGHSRSALFTAKELIKKGNRVVFLTPFGMNHNILINSSLTYYRLPFLQFNLVRGIINGLTEIRKRYGFIRVLHFFGRPHPALLFARAAYHLNIPFCFTVPGGPAPKSFLGLRRVVLFTNELPKRLINDEMLTVDVMPARIDLSTKLDRNSTKNVLINTLQSSVRIESDTFIIGQIARCRDETVDSIILVAEAVSSLFHRGYNVRFIHLGVPQNLNAAKKLARAFKRINARFDLNIVTTIQKDISELWRFSAIFDLQFASGRSALEGMLLGTPIAQVFSSDSFVLMDSQTISIASNYNFTSRSQSELTSYSKPLEQIVDALIQQPELKNSLRSLYSQTLRKFDSANSAEFYENYYLKCYPPNKSEIYKNSVKIYRTVLKLKLSETKFLLLNRFRKNINAV